MNCGLSTQKAPENAKKKPSNIQIYEYHKRWIRKSAHEWNFVFVHQMVGVGDILLQGSSI